MSGLGATPHLYQRWPWHRWLALTAGLLGSAALLGAATATSPVLGLAGGLSMCLGAALLRWPAAATMLAIALVYSNAAVVAVAAYGAPAAVAAVVPVLLVVQPGLELRRGVRILVPPLVFAMLALLVVELVSGVGARDQDRALAGVLVYVGEGLVLVGLLINAVRTRGLLRAALWTVLLVGAVLGALSVIQVATGTYAQDYAGFATNSDVKVERYQRDLFGERQPPRVEGPIGEKNRYAQILVVLVPLGIMLARAETSRGLRSAALVATLLVAAGGVLTYSRGAAVALFAVVVLMVVLRELRVRYLVAVVLLGVIVAVAFPRWAERFSSALDAVGSDEGIEAADGSVRGRLSSTLGALQVYSQHPVIGVGPAQYPLYHRDAAEQVDLRIEDTRQPHNLYAQVLAETGTLGAVGFATIVWLALRATLRARRRAHDDPLLRGMATGLLVALLTYLVSGMFLHLSYERYFWLLIGLATTLLVVSGQRVPGVRLSLPTKPA